MPAASHQLANSTRSLRLSVRGVHCTETVRDRLVECIEVVGECWGIDFDWRMWTIVFDWCHFEPLGQP